MVPANLRSWTMCRRQARVTMAIFVGEWPGTPGLEAELGLSELIQVYNALAREMLRHLNDLVGRARWHPRTGCYAFLWRWMALFMRKLSVAP